MQDSDTTAENDIREQLRELMGESWRETALAEPEQPAAPSGRAGTLIRDSELGSNSATSRLEEAPATPAATPDQKFFPLAPTSLEEAGLRVTDIESIVLKMMLREQSLAARLIAKRTALPYSVIEPVLQQLKERRELAIRESGGMNDFVYELTDIGGAKARELVQTSSYAGTVPVPLDDYVASVKAQSIAKLRVGPSQLKKAFADLELSEIMFNRLGRAVTAGLGMFIYGSPGNGKTSIAERVTKAYGETIWIPRTIWAWGEVIRLFDPSIHEEMELVEGNSLLKEEIVDSRWVRIRRPTVVVGGELTLESLDVRVDHETGIAEAPLQMKSNCGTFVVDDFGRQRISPDALLNRWIIPLEKRYDYLSLASGRKIQVPFDQFVVFSTNLEPKDLVDEAFLRRIPYKICVDDPDEKAYRDIFRVMADKAGVAYNESAIDYLIETYYRGTDRPMRFCHPRDLLRQVEVYYRYLDELPHLSHEAIDAAADTYFSIV
jgi:hypothetical protein